VTDGALPADAGRTDDRPVIHRALRHAPTLPARRGMLASAYRGRSSPDPAPPAVETPVDPATPPVAVIPVGPGLGTPPPAAHAPGRSWISARLTIRPVHGHPTF
jgi:hypothetical protein